MEIKFRISDDGIKKFYRLAIRSAKTAPPQFRKGAFRIVAAALTIIVLMSSWKWIVVKREASARETEIKAGPRVATTKVVESKPQYTVTVIGEARPFREATLYAKVSGYLKSVLVDKGDVVRLNQQLAVIDSPETDKDYNAAAADAKNKHRIAERMETLAKRNLVSAQEVEQSDSDAEIAQAKLEAMAVAKSYKILRAPFPGTITARFADPGSLMQNAANSQTSAQPVLTVSQINQLRIYVYLDQKDAHFVHPGDPVTISLTDRNDFKLKATVTRLSGSLDEKTRMLLTEIDVDNSKGEIVPGSYVQVLLNISRPVFRQVPVEAFVLRNEKSLVPVIASDSTIHFKEVEVANNDGRIIDIRSGVNEGELVALNIGSVPEGGKVRPILQEIKK